MPNNYPLTTFLPSFHMCNSMSDPTAASSDKSFRSTNVAWDPHHLEQLCR